MGCKSRSFIQFAPDWLQPVKATFTEPSEKTCHSLHIRYAIDLTDYGLLLEDPAEIQDVASKLQASEWPPRTKLLLLCLELVKSAL